MFKAGFIDTWGRGYKKIRDGYEAPKMLTLTLSSFGATRQSKQALLLSLLQMSGIVQASLTLLNRIFERLVFDS